MILPTGRSRMVLLGTGILVVLAVASFLVFSFGTGSVASGELPVVRIGQVDQQATEDQAEPDSTTTTVGAATTATAVSSGTSSGSAGGSVSPSGAVSSLSSPTTQSTVRQYVQEDVRVQDSRPSRDNGGSSRDSNDGSYRRPGQGRR
jgi:hypothetical protein